MQAWANYNAETSGALQMTTAAKSHTLPSGTGAGLQTYSLDASRSSSIYGASTSVSVSSKTVRFIIKY
jgi:hypothetical protein